MSHSRYCLCALAGSALIAAACAGAQQNNSAATAPSAPPPGSYSLQVNAQIVALDVVVTNQKGETVSNLSKDDFTVYEDKAPQKIVSFDPSSVFIPPPDVSADSTHAVDRLEPNVPVNIIVLDEVNTRFEDEAFARYSMKRYLNSQGDLLPLPTMLVAVNMKHFMVLRDYTRSKKEILYALDHHLADYPWQMKGSSFNGERFIAGFASLMEVAQATAGHAGHKNLIWIGRGIPTIDPMKLSAAADAELKTAIQSCTNMLRDARVTLYTVDPAGVPTQPPATDENGFYEDDPFGGQVDFNAMAEATGGKAFFGRNDVDHLIESSARDGENFYTLTYKPPPDSEKPKPFRNIRVVMRDPSLRATTREGYYPHVPAVPQATDANGKPSDRLVFDLSAAGQSMMVYDAVPLTLVRDPAARDNFRIDLNSSDVDWQPAADGKYKTSLAVLVETFDKKGKLLNHTAHMTGVEVPATTTELQLKTRHVILPATIPTGPPAARVRFVVRVNSTGKLGADNFFLVDRKTLTDPTTGETPGR